MRLHTGTSGLYARAAVALAAAAVLLLLWPCVARAQSSAGRRDERRADMEARQRALHSVGELAARAPKKGPDRRPLYRQVAEDFEQLQVRSYQLSWAFVPGAPLDYKLIKYEAAEVRKRASRLKSTLALPLAKTEQKGRKPEETQTPEGLRAAAAALDELVKSFVWNPIFQRPDVIDLENLQKAARELEEILRLSEQVKNSAESLGKAAGKSQ